MNYEIIKDRKMLEEFIDWLPDLEPQEQFYCCLFSRSKYLKDENGVNQLPHIKTDKAQLKRFTSTKDRLIHKIQQLEIKEGLWYQKEHSVPQAALALYILPNPRDLWKASFNSLIKLSQAIRDDNRLMNPSAEVLSEIQKSKSRTCWVDFDIDFEDGDTVDGVVASVLSHVNKEAVTFLKTRGGIHALVDPKKVDPKFKNSFYKGLASISGTDIKGDIMIPVPGCTQGNFIPHFINF